MKLKLCIALLLLSAATAAEVAALEKKASKPIGKAETGVIVEPPHQESAAVLETVAPANTVQTIRVLLLPEKETIISSTIAARIIGLNASMGQSFKAGDVLVTFDCKEAQARVEMSKAELAGAIEQHEAKVKMQGLDQASDVEVALAASAANKAKAELELHKAQVAQCSIYAPWSGRVAKLHIKNHMAVTLGQPMLELVKNGPLKLKMNMPSKLLSAVKVGNKLNVIIDETGKSYLAAISAINSRVDPVSQTIEVEARLTKSYSELLPGMSGIVE